MSSAKRSGADPNRGARCCLGAGCTPRALSTCDRCLMTRSSPVSPLHPPPPPPPPPCAATFSPHLSPPPSLPSLPRSLEARATTVLEVAQPGPAELSQRWNADARARAAAAVEQALSNWEALATSSSASGGTAASSSSVATSSSSSAGPSSSPLSGSAAGSSSSSGAAGSGAPPPQQ